MIEDLSFFSCKKIDGDINSVYSNAAAQKIFSISDLSIRKSTQLKYYLIDFFYN